MNSIYIWCHTSFHMGKKILFLFILIPFISFGQCLTCAKNFGSWTDDFVYDYKKSVDGIYFMGSGLINKYDFNCNLLWSKTLGANKMTSDDQGNIYVLTSYSGSIPVTINGLLFFPGLTLLKFDTNGNFIWSRSLGLGINYGMRDVYFNNGNLYVTGTFVQSITICNQITLSFTYNGDEKAFVAKLNLAGDLLDAKEFGTGRDTYAASEIDSNGNIYLSSFKRGPNAHSDLYKINSNLQLDWSVQISNDANGPAQSIYEPRYLHFNPINNKLYLWGHLRNNVTILGNLITGSMSGIQRSVLTEFNVQNGALERFKKINNISLNWGNYVNPMASAYMAEKNNDLYILTNFRNSLQFTSSTIVSSPGINGLNYDLVLFKVDLANFATSFVLKSFSNPNDAYGPSQDMAGPMFFINDSLYLSSTFESNPLTINGTVINNNSGNGDSDAMFYRYDLNGPNTTNAIDVNTTCLTEATNFNLSGSFDTINWDFADPASGSNSATINNPQHQFSAPGNYHVTATVTCGANTQTLFTDVVIDSKPTINAISPISECETIAGSGICSAFNTSTIQSQLIGIQQNTTVEYRNSNGIILPSPLPNPYTNATVGGDLITARVFFTNNPDCYVETTIQFNTLPRSLSPSMASPQKFCIQQNAILNDIVITGSNIKWYDAATAGNLLAGSTILQDGITYYASQTLIGCESLRVPVVIQIQNTATPTGTNQSFCATQNNTLNDVIANGTAIQWFNSLSSTLPLPASTLLTNNTTYYATQTVNGCESIGRLAVAISLIYTLNASNYATNVCDEDNDGNEDVVLSDFDNFMITPATGNIFSYYSAANAAENQIASEQIGVDRSLNIGLNSIYVRIDASSGCHQVVMLQLTLVSKPVITILDELVICEDTRRLIVTADTGFDSYAWSTGATSSSIIVTHPGNYWITVSQNHGLVVCTTTHNFTVDLSNAPTITSIDIIDWTDNQNNIIVNLSATSLGNYEYSIDGTTFQDSNVFSGLLSGQYIVTVKDKNGCGWDTKEVHLLNYAKFFTPNGDGYNDNWHVEFAEFEPNFEAKIFDRYGNLLKVLDNIGFWDGTVNGKLLPSDDYWFYVTRNDGKIYKGHFALKR